MPCCPVRSHHHRVLLLCKSSRFTVLISTERSRWFNSYYPLADFVHKTIITAFLTQIFVIAQNADARIMLKQDQTAKTTAAFGNLRVIKSPYYKVIAVTVRSCFCRITTGFFFSCKSSRYPTALISTERFLDLPEMLPRWFNSYIWNHNHCVHSWHKSLKLPSKQKPE